MTKIADKVAIAAGIIFFLSAAEELWLHSRILATSDILLGIGLILGGVSLSRSGVRKKVTRGLSFGFLGAGIVFLGIWLAANVP